ncbi:hypothetical protein BJB45_06610 [Halomonas huangheensis]|uniref:Uncharacterized protein n=2 Tax=Halomonas huangheensis TaxID=1178482 RepID=W1N2P4_9GAMM|nr:hypothetical protein AR456_07950 [Halomonas huangheensis]ERL49446.1 hypothetical protein BJB45_06610 [Halomonas huangheensis]
MPKTRVVVLTGDLIDSQRSTTRALYEQLDARLETLATRYNGAWSRFRGDGFQMVLQQADAGMDAAVALRANLIGSSPDDQRWDARIAIATGESHWTPEHALEDANDAPFIASGKALDHLSDSDEHLLLAGSDDAQQLLVRYLDEMLNGWSTNSAESVALCLDEPGITQARLATLLGIRQPSVHKRLQVARWELLNATLTYFRRHCQDTLLNRDAGADRGPSTETETQG